ncbi:MAG TPA: hypothetical protein VJZ25_04560 [Gemmatimonadaceae bacterium]|nr:hypothetical protein [Gemmatimonadaceae bacterium]
MMALPSEGSDIVRSAEHSSRMTPRFGLITGAALAALVALVLAFVPADWLAGLLGVSGVDATTFAFGHVGGLAWAAVVADPLIAGWFIALSAKVDTG